MSETFKLQGYTFILARKNDTALTITASPDINKSIFESGVIDLKRIKCDTVAAAFANSNSKNLNIKLNYEEGNQPFTGQLLISIIIKYQFLPQFSQDIVLNERKLDEGDALKVRLANLQNELDFLNKVVATIGNQGVLKINQEKLSSLRETNHKQKNLSKGKYLVQISGLHKASSHSTIGFKILIEGNNKKSQVILSKISPFFINAAYTSPFSISQLIELEEDSIVKVVNKQNNTYNSTANNFIITYKPVL